MEPSTVPPTCTLTEDGEPHTIRDYQLLHPISRGGCGAVWVARHSQLRTESALKIVFDHAGAVEEDAIRLYKENVRIEDYAFLVPIEHFGRTEEGRRYYVMPLADDLSGSKVLRSATGYRPNTLATRLAARGPFSLDELLEIADQLLLALTCLHGYGLVHRDVKPLNVLRVQQRWRLGDFGLMTLRSTLRARPDTASGTYWYRPPGEPADFPMDVYALGKTLFVLATEAAPPRKPGEPDPFVAFLGGSLRLKQDDSRADPLRATLVRACAPDPAERVTLGEMRRAISRLVSATRWVQLRIPGDFDHFTEHDRLEWLAKIETLGVVVLANKVERGSILLQVQLTAAQADYLCGAVSAGALATWGVSEATEVIPGPGAGALTAEQPRASPAIRQQTSVLAGQPIPGARKRFWLVLAAGVVLVMLPLLVVLLWPKSQPSPDTSVTVSVKPPDPTDKSDPTPPRVKPVTEINGYRIEVVSCSLQGHVLTCKLKFTNLLGGGTAKGRRPLRIAIGGRASATFDNETTILQSPGSMMFDGRTGYDLLNPGVSMDKDEPREMIVKFSDVPESVKKVAILDFGFITPDQDIKVRDIEIERK